MDRSNQGEGAAEGFDPTNGMVDGLEGDSDGTAEADTRSEAERGADDDADDEGGVGFPAAGQGPQLRSMGGL
ncbi:hypothetical protein ACFFGH_30960 [Lysobacter korlensis]|uniref:Uncharacterized protein n=1 Tax=Lysobacter korlensis TaxID=553636 RepID=A0ABV6S0P5_9GAMM